MQFVQWRVLESREGPEWTNYVLEVDTAPHWERQKPLRYHLASNGQRLARSSDLATLARVFPTVTQEVASWLNL